MEYSKLKMYGVTEFSGGLVITDANDKVKDPSAVALMRGASEDVCEYLVRYMHGRETGKDRKQAHEAALAGAGIEILPPGAK